MRIAPSLLSIALVSALPSALNAATPYPTLETVDHVLTCMRENGGQNIDNLQRCSCEIDVIAQQMSFDDFNAARTYEIYKQMPGEKGGLFRESDLGQAQIEKLEAARVDARKRCFVGATRQQVTTGKKGLVQPAQQVAPAAPAPATAPAQP